MDNVSLIETIYVLIIIMIAIGSSFGIPIIIIKIKEYCKYISRCIKEEWNNWKDK